MFVLAHVYAAETRALGQGARPGLRGQPVVAGTHLGVFGFPLTMVDLTRELKEEAATTTGGRSQWREAEMAELSVHSSRSCRLSLPVWGMGEAPPGRHLSNNNPLSHASTHRSYLVAVTWIC